MTSFPIDYPISEHERVIEAYFEQHRGEDNPGPVSPQSEHDRYSHFVICFVNRSGSNFLARALMSTGQFGRAGEYFNHPQVTRVAADQGIRSLEDYARATRTMRMTPNRIFGTKLGWGQLYYLTKRRVIPNIFSDTRFILIERRDVLGQAISFSIAYQTQVWHSEQQGSQHEYRFDPEDILSRIRGITTAYARFKEYFAVFGIRPIYVVYEELERDVVGTVQRVIEELDLPGCRDARVDPTAIGLQRQRGPLTEQVREKFLACTALQSPGADWPKVAPPSSR